MRTSALLCVPAVSARRGKYHRLTPRAAGVIRCAAVGGSGAEGSVSLARAISSQPSDGVRLLPRELLPATPDAQLVATVAAKAVAAPPPPAQPVNGFVAFCRGNWPLFVFAQTGALIGAAYSGIDSRNKRLEIAKLNDKLRAMMDKVEQGCTFQWSVDEDDEDDWPGSKELSDAKRALQADDLDAAMAAFAAAKTAVMEYSGKDCEKMDGKAAGAKRASHQCAITINPSPLWGGEWGGHSYRLESTRLGVFPRREPF